MGRLLLDDVTVRVGGAMLLDGVSLEVPDGSVTGLIGPNGAGKTTLFNVACGLVAPSAGRVILDGSDVTATAAHLRSRRGLARTFQHLELFGSLTVEENLLVAAEARTTGPSRPILPGARRRARERFRSVLTRIDEVAATCGLEHVLELRADQLSTGQARQAELARALLTEPGVLLADEPASGLDAAERDRLVELLGSLAVSGLAVLLVDHDVPLVFEVSERVVVLDRGSVIAEGSPEQVRSDPSVVTAYLGVAP